MDLQYKLLALDLDGTLLTSDKRITKNTVKNINKARKRGLKVIIATGRDYSSAKLIAQKLQLKLPIITNNGAYIVNSLNDEVIFEKRLNNRVLLEIIDILDRYELKYMIRNESYSFGSYKPKMSMLFRFLNIQALRHLWLLRSSYKSMDDAEIKKHIKEKKIEPLKIFVHGKKVDTDNVELELVKTFKDEIGITTSGYGIEILPKKISKASGLEILTPILGVDKDEVMAIGDNFNDLEMIKYVGLDIAMGNAPNEIQKHAKFVTETNDNDGVAFAIEKFVLKDPSLVENS